MNSLLTLRPFQIVLMTIFGLLALVGLYLFANYTGFGSQGVQIGTVTIWGTLPQAAIQKEIGTLASTNKAYGKISYVQKQATTFDSDLADAIASGVGPDLVLISQEQLVTEKNKLNVTPFSAIPQRVFLDTYLPEFKLFLTSTGTYGIPYVLDPLVLYYNQNILTAGGVALVPKTWEAVSGIVPNVTKTYPDQSLAQSAIALGQYNNVDNARAILSLLLLQSGSTITADSNVGVRSVLAQSSTNSIDGASAAESALNFYTQFSDSGRTVYSWNASLSSARQAFLGGSLALYIGFASELAPLQAANPNLKFDMAQIPQPQTASQPIDYGVAYAFAIPKASHNPAGAYLAATALAGKGVDGKVAADLGMAPAQRSLLVATPSDPYAPVYYPDALIAQGWLSPAPQTTDAVFSAMINNITSGRYPTRQALFTADQALNAALPQS